MKKNLAIIALAASALFAGTAQAVSVEYNGGIFDFSNTGCVGTTCTIVYTADFTNFSSGSQTHIGGIQWTISGSDVISGSLTAAPGGVGAWTPADIDTNLSANGCSGGANNAVCIESVDPVLATGMMSWTFSVVFGTALPSNFNATNIGNPIRMWFVDANGRNRGLMSCVTGNANGECGTSVPEPGTLALIGLGLLGIGAARRRRA